MWKVDNVYYTTFRSHFKPPEHCIYSYSHNYRRTIDELHFVDYIPLIAPIFPDFGLV
jgi:hypothetical protein